MNYQLSCFWWLDELNSDRLRWTKHFRWRKMNKKAIKFGKHSEHGYNLAFIIASFTWTMTCLFTSSWCLGGVTGRHLTVSTYIHSRYPIKGSFCLSLIILSKWLLSTQKDSANQKSLVPPLLLGRKSGLTAVAKSKRVCKRTFALTSKYRNLY